MMGFKTFLAESDMQMRDLTKKITPVIEELCQRNTQLSRPTRLIAIGNSGGHVYHTTDKAVVVRAAPSYKSEGEKHMADPSMQDTGGVAAIYHLEEGYVEDERYTFSWKEYVNTNVRDFLGGLKLTLLARVLTGLYSADEDEIQMLAKYKQTAGLYEVIRMGLPANDLDIRANLGVTSDGRVVAYDC